MKTTEEIAEKLRNQPIPDWVQRLHAECRKTGAYSAASLRKLLGDPTARIDVGPNVAALASLSQKKS